MIGVLSVVVLFGMIVFWVVVIGRYVDVFMIYVYVLLVIEKKFVMMGSMNRMLIVVVMVLVLECRMNLKEMLISVNIVIDRDDIRIGSSDVDGFD